MIKNEKILVAEYIGHHYFLPGGHIEIGECINKRAKGRTWSKL